MKKIAIATLLVATSLVATAQVSLNGKISAFVDNTKAGAYDNTTLVTDPTSNITLRSEMTLFDENVRPKPCYNEIISLLKDYDVSDYNSKKSIFPPYNVLNYRYRDLASMGD